MMRTHNCGQLRDADIDNEVELSGWVHTRRDHGGVIFIDLRDRFGLTQIVFNPDDKDMFSKAESLRREDVLNIKGKVRARPENMENPNLDTGKVEVVVHILKILAKAKTPPIEVDDRIVANEDIRLKYRYLDLRRPIMQKHLRIRHEAAMAARECFNKHGFLEVETPLLVRATPEGARDYLVPSRVNPGNFYALPQSPQLYKQILMVSGVDRYYQFARCLRDEDLRQDRQPEHTQMDLEMSFVTEKDIMSFVETLYKHILKKVLNIEIKERFPVLTYAESIARYGTDKPDTRFGLELADVTDVVKDSEFGVFTDVVASGGVVKCINPEADMSRKEIDSLIEYATGVGAKGMAWMRVTDQGLDSNIAKYFNKDLQNRLLDATGAAPGTILMFIADREEKANEILAALRTEIAKRLGLIKQGEFKFCWIVDYPLFEWDDDAQRWSPAHHIFSKPKEDCIKYIEEDPEKVLANLFDIVLNGIELGSGSIRISDPELQKRVMKVIGLSEEEAMKKFGFLLEAYRYGGPPHGGMGLGFDRLVAIMCGFNDIREVIAFPKNKSAQCPMDQSPSDVDPAQLKELSLKLDIVKK